MIVVDNEFDIGDAVYLRTDVDQKVRLVVALMVHRDHVRYNLVCGTVDTWHEAIEISTTKDVALSTGTD